MVEQLATKAVTSGQLLCASRQPGWHGEASFSTGLSQFSHWMHRKHSQMVWYTGVYVWCLEIGVLFGRPRYIPGIDHSLSEPWARGKLRPLKKEWVTRIWRASPCYAIEYIDIFKLLYDTLIAYFIFNQRGQSKVSLNFWRVSKEKGLSESIPLEIWRMENGPKLSPLNFFTPWKARGFEHIRS